MKKKSLILFFLLLANIVMLVHSVVPHHHHESHICIDFSLFHPEDSSHHHQKHPCKGCCDLNNTQVVPCETQKKDFTLQKTQHDFSLLHAYIACSKWMIKKIEQPSYPLDYADKIPLCCIYVNQLLGLRAPPAIA